MYDATLYRADQHDQHDDDDRLFADLLWLYSWLGFAWSIVMDL